MGIAAGCRSGFSVCQLPYRYHLIIYIFVANLLRWIIFAATNQLYGQNETIGQT